MYRLRQKANILNLIKFFVNIVLSCFTLNLSALFFHSFFENLLLVFSSFSKMILEVERYN